MYDLGSFTMADKVACAGALRTIGAEAVGVADTAARVVRFFYDNLGDPETGARSCALVRLYLTKPFEELDEGQRAFALARLGALTGEPASPRMKCLTLLATAGDLEAWNSPERSAAHRAIPLASEEVVRRSPMIAQLIGQLGLQISQVLEPDPSLLVNLGEADYDVFYVPVAAGSPFIPAQEEFVAPYGVESVLGVGGLLPAGEFYALVLFSKARVPLETARLFKTFALSVKSALLASALAERD
jgi:hypothetical protein